MGLTKQSVGMGAVDSGLEIKKQTPEDKVIAIAGNPNVGKSTLFNNLTGMNQHTGNWPGKTVTNAQGFCKTRNHGYVLVDIPGTYSLMAHSAEEEVARNFICFGGSDSVVVVCDATCLERNMNLVLQTMEISDHVLVCVNLLDEAARKNISIDLEMLSEKLGVPVVGTIARKKKSLEQFLKQLDALVDDKKDLHPYQVQYSPIIEQAIAMAEPLVKARVEGKINSRWLTLKLLDSDPSLMKELKAYLGEDILDIPELTQALDEAREHLSKYGVTREIMGDRVVAALVASAEKICRDTVHFNQSEYNEGDRRLDKILTSRFTGYPVMIGMLAVVFWLTITGANYPSQMLADAFFRLQDQLTRGFMAMGAPDWLHGILILGVYRVLAWVVSVMLPPMAIFFPLFTLLEDAGYLPRVAFNLDHLFRCAGAHGRQSLTMCMGFGCNACGVMGCRIIDSPRERLIAILTNSFVPCNGRFPTLIAILTIFFSAAGGGSLLSALLLLLTVVLSVLLTLLASWLLSKTVLRGAPSAFSLELPPYRRPQIGQVIVRSVLDRTLFVLGRAVAVAAPAGLLLWCLANIAPGGVSLLARCGAFLDPLGQLMGLDGMVLAAFLLGLPANEIVIPILLMGYLSSGMLTSYAGLGELRSILLANGWTWHTAVCMVLFTLFHFPCGTTCLTIRRETGSVKWTLLAIVLPLLSGVVLCTAANLLLSLLPF